MEILRYTAFSTDPGGGNPAGIVLDAADLDAADMQRIAAEIGFSETAFLTPTGPGTADVRYFAPIAEVAFCGHATIASAVAMAERVGTGSLTLASAAGPIAVSTTDRRTGSSPPWSACRRSSPSSTPASRRSCWRHCG